jgi:hypothetical protein
LNVVEVGAGADEAAGVDGAFEPKSSLGGAEDRKGHVGAEAFEASRVGDDEVESLGLVFDGDGDGACEASGEGVEGFLGEAAPAVVDGVIGFGDFESVAPFEGEIPGKVAGFEDGTEVDWGFLETDLGAAGEGDTGEVRERPGARRGASGGFGLAEAVKHGNGLEKGEAVEIVVLAAEEDVGGGAAADGEGVAEVKGIVGAGAAEEVGDFSGSGVAVAGWPIDGCRKNAGGAVQGDGEGGLASGVEDVGVGFELEQEFEERCVAHLYRPVERAVAGDVWGFELGAVWVGAGGEERTDKVGTLREDRAVEWGEPFGIAGGEIGFVGEEDVEEIGGVAVDGEVEG